jgi:hypothetical protein
MDDGLIQTSVNERNKHIAVKEMLPESGIFGHYTGRKEMIEKIT